MELNQPDVFRFPDVNALDNRFGTEIYAHFIVKLKRLQEQAIEVLNFAAKYIGDTAGTVSNVLKFSDECDVQ